MKILTILCLFSLAAASAQSPIVGTWESDMEDEFSDELYVWQFRDDGILLQNEYYEGDLENVYACEYRFSGDEVIISDGLNWDYDSDTGVFVPYEDFPGEQSEIAFDFAVAEGELILSFTNESLLRQLVEGLRADEELELDPAELGLDYDFDDEDLVISDEETIDALQKVFIFSLAAFFEGETGTELVLDPDGDLEDALNILIIAVFRIELEEILGVEVDDLETRLEGDAHDAITAVFEELGILQSDVDDPTQDMLRMAIQELNLITDVIAQFESDFGTGPPGFEFVESHHEIIAPAEFVLPGGQTVIKADSWGQIKGRITR